jgi:hypothetical protein
MEGASVLGAPYRKTRSLQKEPSERITDAKEHEDHRGYDHGDKPDHRPEARSIAVHVCES